MRRKKRRFNGALYEYDFPRERTLDIRLRSAAFKLSRVVCSVPLLLVMLALWPVAALGDVADNAIDWLSRRDRPLSDWLNVKLYGPYLRRLDPETDEEEP